MFQGKGSVVLSYQFLVLYLVVRKTYNMENTIDLRKTGAENIIGKFSKNILLNILYLYVRTVRSWEQIST
jgi:hypothetical protein